MDRHRDLSVRTIKTDVSQSAVVETGLRPRCENIASFHHGLGGDDCLNDVGAVVTSLPIETAIRQGQGNIAAFRATVVDGYGGIGRGHGDRHRRYIHAVDETRLIACNANIGAAVDELCDNSGCAVMAESKIRGRLGI